jgi:hypothetical protein
VPGIGVAGTAYAEVPDRSLGDLAFSRASSKTRTNAAGVIQTIGNNVPPHDYRNADGTLSTFPRLNLEPQRTNLVLHSEDFTNAAWAKSRTTISANVTTAPNGTLTADKFIATSATGVHTISQSGFTSQAYSFSVYAKAEEETVLSLFLRSASVGATFNLSNGTVSNITVTSATITNVGDGWYRCFVYDSTPGTTINIYGKTGSSYIGNGIDGFYLWGAQSEAGAYPTTYIPTTTAAVTRLADAASKTGVSSLIGQTEGTLFVDIIPIDVTTTNAIGINNASTIGRVIIFTGSNLIFAQVRVGSVNQFSVSTPASVGVRYKAALAYKGSDFAFYLNGTQIAVSNTGTVPTCSVISYSTGEGGSPFLGGNNQAALFKTRLTNAQLAQLTTL